MNTGDEAYLLVQALYPAEENLLTELLLHCMEQEIVPMHVYQRECSGWYSLSLKISGFWYQLAKLEALLENLGAKFPEAHVFCQRLSKAQDEVLYLPYMIQVQSVVNTYLVDILVQFFNVKHIKLQELQLDRYVQSKTLVPMQQISMVVYLSVDINLPELRENFMILSEQYNFDAVFEPDRG